MLSDEDLQAALAEGIVSEGQVAAMCELAERRKTGHAGALGHEERFTFMRGFNDFFFAVGIVLFAGGMTHFALPTPAGCLIAAAIAWLLAELLVARLRLVLPGILLVCIFAVFFTLAMPIDLGLTRGWQGIDLAALREWFTQARSQPVPAAIKGSPFIGMILYSLIAAAAALVFYARFRLPFALLVVAASLVGAAFATMHYFWTRPSPTEILTFPPPYIQSLVLLGCGLVAFIAAIAYDFSDRERLTRRADCAFWLHLLAAPLIVHSLITLVAPGYNQMLTTPVAIAILAIFAVLTAVAIIIDRRALLISALVYVGGVIAFAITRTVGEQSGNTSFVFFATLLVLGTLVLTLGVGWRPLRRLFVLVLPTALGNRLPPVATPA